MNETQRTVLGVGVAALILALMFFVPWRVHSTGEIKWAPAFRPPVSYTASYATSQPGTRYSYDEAEIAFDLFAAEILAIGIAGGVTFLLSGGAREEEGI